MSTSLSAVLGDPSLSVTVTDTGALNTVIDRIASGVGGFTSLARSLSDGTGSNQAKDYYSVSGTLAAASNLDIDLTSVVGRRGQTITFTKIKWVIIDIGPAATGAFLTFQGSVVSNPIALWKSTNTHDETIEDLLVRCNPVDGWTVDATHKVIRVRNTTGSGIPYRVLVVGTT